MPTARARWQIPGHPHVILINDLVEHDAVDTCVCGPIDQSVSRSDGSVGWITVHHSLDGRERTEAGRRET